MRTAVVVLSVACCWFGCRERTVEPAVEATLTVTPAVVDFGERYVGAMASERLLLTNPGEVTRQVTVSLPAPFSTSRASFDVPGGATESVVLSFAPTAAGLVRATVQVDETTLEVSGTGLPIPPCAPTGPCHEVRFDVETGRCVTAPKELGAGVLHAVRSGGPVPRWRVPGRERRV